MKNLDLRIAGKYQLQRKLGGGGFGAVYIGTNIITGEEVAIKLEHISIWPSFLKLEAEIYESLSGGVGIPRVHDYLLECEYHAMVFDLLGPSLEDLFNFCGRQFSLKTVLMLADQLLHRLEYIHSKNIIHRDVKPENFLMGTGRYGNQVYVTDLGLATERRDVEIESNPARTPKLNLIGTARFASINGHLGVVQHRCDDLESLGYMLVYFLQGSLPWQGLKTENEIQKDELILKKKETISSADLCKDLPKEFGTYFDHVRSLDFDESPAYSYLRKIFCNLFVREGFARDNVFDWTILKYLLSHKEEESPPAPQQACSGSPADSLITYDANSPLPPPPTQPPPFSKLSASPAHSSEDSGVPTPGGVPLIDTIKKWRTAYGLNALEWNSTLEAKARKTGNNDHGSNETRELNPGSMAQVITSGLEVSVGNLNGDSSFDLFCITWLCEVPTDPELEGHHDILCSKSYTAIGCAFAQNPCSTDTLIYQDFWVYDLY